jgi:hypothetical protein
MGRSIKKGPYVDANIEEKVLAINEGKSKKVSVERHGADALRSHLILSVTLLLCTTETNSFLFM